MKGLKEGMTEGWWDGKKKWQRDEETERRTEREMKGPKEGMTKCMAGAIFFFLHSTILFGIKYKVWVLKITISILCMYL